MTAIGLDIGTTSLCAAAVDAQTGEVLRALTAANDSFLPSGDPAERIQDPARILAKARGLVDALLDAFGPAACIGVTGQMHGILYLDGTGEAVSPLYTWQDGSGDAPAGQGRSFAQELSGITGYPMATGFGGTTYYVHARRRNLPPGAVAFCTIHDYAAMRLAGRTRPLCHLSDAASFGLFRLEEGEFDWKAIGQAGMDPALFPEVTADFAVLGEYRRAPVCAALGDNQASFLGSVSDMEDSALVNVGTGSQVSLAVDSPAFTADLEARPLAAGRYLLVGSSLCGGRAFAQLERLFRETAEMVTGQPCESAYPGMDRCLAALTALDAPLAVDTRFSGTRREPARRGAITGIGTDNLTPAHLMLGVLTGVAGELYALYRQADGERRSRVRRLIGSGNGLRNIPSLCRLTAEAFGLPLFIPAHKEEAAFGAALAALAGAGAVPSLREAQRLIRCLPAGETANRRP